MFKTRLDTFENDFGQFWNFETFLIILKIFENPTLHGTRGKIFFRENCHKTCSKQVWTILATFLGISAILKFCWFFRKLSMTPWNTGQKIFSKKSPQNTFGHLETFLDIFGTLKFFWFFPLIFSKSLPQNLGPENWTHIFQVRKTELIFLIWGIWTHSFESRKSEMGLRILTVAWMQKESLLSIVSENWTPIFKSGKLNFCFQVRESDAKILSPENLKWNRV